MAHDGKIENWGSGSRRSPQRRAENAARRSQKRAGERRWRRDEEGRREVDAGPLPEPACPVAVAFMYLTVALMEWKEPPNEPWN